MPIDPYRLKDMHFQASGYLSELLVGSCMRGAGFEFPVTSIFLHAPPRETENIYGRSLFSRSIAERWGYRPAPDATSHSAEVRDNKLLIDRLGETDPQYDPQLESCFKSAETRYTPKVYDLQLAAGLAMDADDAALRSQPVKDAMKRWRECMGPQGVPDLPEIPFYLSSAQSVIDRFELEGETVTIWNKGIPASAEEIAFATFDAECQSSSGFEKAWYDANWNAQLSLIEKHADELERVRAAIAADWADVQRRLAAAEQPH
jgi:hypothetical protein